MTDKQLRLTIINELDFEPSIDAAHISVAVEDGVVGANNNVTLEGKAHAWYERGIADACGLVGNRRKIRRRPSDGGMRTNRRGSAPPVDLPAAQWSQHARQLNRNGLCTAIEWSGPWIKSS